VTLTLTVPALADMHVHARQGEVLSVLESSAKYAQHILLMPNTNPPLLKAADVQKYAQEVESYLEGTNCKAHYTLYVNEDTTPTDIEEAHEIGVLAGKIYPRAATTGSDAGVRYYHRLLPVLETMQRLDMVCCLHGEAPWIAPDGTVLDWERAFVENEFRWIVQTLPKLRVVLEHITTAEAVRAVNSARPGVAATITAHHLMLTIDDVLAAGIQPLNYCKPIAKTYLDRKALRRAVLTPSGRFMFGSDSAPHDYDAKVARCGCAGCFTAPIVPSALATVFEQLDIEGEGRLDAFRDFTFWNAVNFYELGVEGGLNPQHLITLEREQPALPEALVIAGRSYPVWQATYPWSWRLAE